MNEEKELKVISVECPNCGANLVTSSKAISVKCHWCHTNVPTDKSMTNPIIPDRILPFKITKEEAKNKIEEYLSDKKRYAKREFIDELNLDSIIPVYLPYMLVDVNAHSCITGIGEMSDEGQVCVSKVNREFDLNINDLLIESSKSNSFNSFKGTSNVISAVSPFDTENSVVFNINYLNGFSSEIRDLDVVSLKLNLPEIVNEISKDIAKKDDSYFDRGISWDRTTSKIIGTQWTSSFLPIWLYSYYEKETGIKYFIAVNGRTGKTIGSVPYNDKKMRKSVKIRTFTKPLTLIALILSIAFIVVDLCILPQIDQEFGEPHVPGGMGHGLALLGGFFLIILLMIKYFDYYKMYDDEREKYSSFRKNIDHVNNTNYQYSNNTTNDELIDKYTTSRPSKNKKNSKVEVVSID